MTAVNLGAVEDSPKGKHLGSSPSTTSKLSLKALKNKQQSQVKFQAKKPPVPSLYNSSMPPTSSKMNNTGFRTARGGSNKVVDLKPIHHTEHKKFKPHPNNFAKFRTSLPPPSKKSF